MDSPEKLPSDSIKGSRTSKYESPFFLKQYLMKFGQKSSIIHAHNYYYCHLGILVHLKMPFSVHKKLYRPSKCGAAEVKSNNKCTC